MSTPATTGFLLSLSKESYGSDFQKHLLDQYKLYVEMADKISERRQTVNTFFLTINATLVTMLGISWPSKDSPTGSEPLVGNGWYLVIGLAGLTLCYSWYRLLKSYRDLITSKFKVIYELERHLPAKPYSAEWSHAGCDKDTQFHLPFTHIETKVPWIFLLIYLLVAASGALRWWQSWLN